MSDAPVRLFTGPGSRRLELLVLEAARLVVCRSGGRCGEECSDCRRLRAREHPDLLIGAPEKRRRVHVPPFEEGETKETTLPTALVRAVVATASALPYEATLRAVILLDVDRTEPAAFSALLKVLEEPPQKTRFLLTATRPRLLPETILSRVALEKAPLLTREETAARLRARGVGREEADARAAFVPGDDEEAAALDLAAARELRDRILEALSGTLLSGSIPWALALADLLSGDDAAGTGARLQLTALQLRDAVAAPTDPAGSAVAHRERFRDLAALAAVDAERLLAASARALDLGSTLPDSRRNPRLAVEAFALSLAREAA